VRAGREDGEWEDAASPKRRVAVVAAITTRRWNWELLAGVSAVLLCLCGTRSGSGLRDWKG